MTMQKQVLRERPLEAGTRKEVGLVSSPGDPPERITQRNGHQAQICKMDSTTCSDRAKLMALRYGVP